MIDLSNQRYVKVRSSNIPEGFQKNPQDLKVSAPPSFSFAKTTKNQGFS